MTTLPGPLPARFDGTSGNLVQRAEPKVRAASAVALLLPVALYYIAAGVPALAAQPPVVLALATAVLTGLLTFAAGFATRAVDRVDLFANLKASAREAEAVTVQAAAPAAATEVAAVLPRLPPAVQVAIRAETPGAVQQLEQVAPVLAPVVDGVAVAVAAGPPPTATDPAAQRAVDVARAAAILGIHPAMLGTLADLYAAPAASTPGDVGTPVYDASVSATTVTQEMPAVGPFTQPNAAIPVAAG